MNGYAVKYIYGKGLNKKENYPLFVEKRFTPPPHFPPREFFYIHIKKSRMRETLTISTDADSSDNTIFFFFPIFWGGQNNFFFGGGGDPKRKNIFFFGKKIFF